MIFISIVQSHKFFTICLLIGTTLATSALCKTKYLQDYPFVKTQFTIKADSFLNVELYDDAYLYYQKALTEYQSSDNWNGIAYTNNKMGFIKIAELDLEKGKELLERSHEIIRKYIDNENQIIADYSMFLGIYFTRTVQKDSALYYHNRGIDLKRNLYGDESLTLAESYRFKAEYLMDFESLTLSEKLYRQSIEMYLSFLPSDHFVIGKVYSSLSGVLRQEFDYDNAVMYAKKAVEILANARPGNINTYVKSVIILGNIYTDFNKSSLGIKYHTQAMNLIASNKTINQKYLWYAYHPLAINYSLNDKPEKALKYLQYESDLFKEVGSIVSYGPALMNEGYGIAFSHTGQFELAKEYAMKSLSQMRSLFGENYLATNYETLGYICDRAGENDSALYYYQQALISLVENFDDHNIYSNPYELNNPNALKQYDILYSKANSLMKRYFEKKSIDDLKAALWTYTLIDKLNDQSRNSRMADASLLTLNEYFSAEYEKAIDCAYLLFKETGERYYLDTAFILMEKSKYMLLFKSLSLAEKSHSIDLPVNLKYIEDSLKAHYTMYQVTYNNEKKENPDNKEYIDDLSDKVFNYGKALDDLKIRIQREFPSYAQIKYDSLFKSLGDFKSYCNENGYSGIEYYWGEMAIYRVYTDRNGQSISKIERTSEFDNALLEVLKLLKKGISFSSIKEDFANYIRSTNFIYEHILKDIIDNRDTKDQNFLIIPDGLLSKLPFEALVTKDVDQETVDYKKLAYLLKSFNIRYAYSANLLLNESREKSNQKNNLLAFSYSGLRESSPHLERSEDYVELPNTEYELNAIKKEIGRKGSRYYYDFNATEHRFKSDASNYQILHLAVHGETDTSNAINSRLIFKDSLDTYEDGNLYMHELYMMDLSNAELAVLSACETGIGKEFKGEGVFSMARGFAYAGCPSIVMSLWQVSDKHTADLMSRFYKHLNKGNKISESLSKSKLEFLQESDQYSAHPSNWAAFVPVGKNTELSNQNYTLYYIILVVVALLVLVLIRRSRKRSIK